MTYDVTLVELAPQQVAVVRGKETVEGIAGFLGLAFGLVMQSVGPQGGFPMGPPFARYSREDDGAFEIEAGFPVAGPVQSQGDVVVYERPGGSAAQTMHQGEYSAVGAAFEAVERWLADNGWVISDAPWEEYLDEPTVPQPRTLVTFPCAR